MAGELNLAFVMAPPENSQITTLAVAQTPLYVALPQSHAAAQKEQVVLQDLERDEWILFARRIHPVVHDAIIEAAQGVGIALRQTHHIMTVQQAVHLVSEHAGVAILTQPGDTSSKTTGVVVKPLADASLRYKTCVITRTESESRLVSEFVRTFLSRHAYQRPQPKQMELSLSA